MMMNGLVPITADEYREYFEKSDQFYYLPDIKKNSSFTYSKESDLLVAYKDSNGECFSRTCYWKIA